MSKIEICNQGLSMYLGQGRITSFDQDLPQAEQCKTHYDPALKLVLERHWWDFATGFQNLALLENDRPKEWLYRYQRPGTALSIRWVNDPTLAQTAIERGEDPDAPRKNAAGSIYSNVPNAACEFTKWETDTTLFPQHFSDAVSAVLAARVAMPLTEDIRRTRNAAAEAREALDLAIEFDEGQTPPKQTNSLPDYLKDRGI